MIARLLMAAVISICLAGLLACVEPRPDPGPLMQQLEKADEHYALDRAELLSYLTTQPHEKAAPWYDLIRQADELRHAIRCTLEVGAVSVHPAEVEDLYRRAAEIHSSAKKTLSASPNNRIHTRLEIWDGDMLALASTYQSWLDNGHRQSDYVRVMRAVIRFTRRVIELHGILRGRYELFSNAATG